MRLIKDSTFMELAGQATETSSPAPRGTRLDDAGFVMVALLVSMAVTAVWMSALLPAWRQQVQREKEAELIFRGEAIARAIYLYRQKNGQNLPPSLDTLVSQRFLRQKYIDPITGKDFLPVAGATAGPGGGRAGGPGQLQGGIIGVRSTSNETSIRIYNNQQTYSQWAFDFTLEQLRAGGGPAGGVVVPDGGGPRGGGGGGRIQGGRIGAGSGGRGGGVRGGARGDGGVAPITPGGGRAGGGFGGRGGD
jgi:type II secretory pathway pseudopilin PulG